MTRGSQSDDEAVTDQLYLNRLSKSSSWVLTAGGEDREVLDQTEKSNGHSPFASALLERLTGGPDFTDAVDLEKAILLSYGKDDLIGYDPQLEMLKPGSLKHRFVFMRKAALARIRQAGAPNIE